MQILNSDLPTLIGTLVSFLLTLAVFSYLFFGDNLLVRIALYLFIGVATGYAAVVAWYNVIWPQLIVPIVFGSPERQLFALFPLLLSGLLLLKLSPRLARFGSPAVAYIVGVGMAAAVGGATIGTLFPQVGATLNLLDLRVPAEGGVLWQLSSGAVALLGTVTTMIYFHYSARPASETSRERPVWIEWLGSIGLFFVTVALAVFFAGVFLAAMAALVERLLFLAEFIRSLFAFL